MHILRNELKRLKWQHQSPNVEKDNQDISGIPTNILTNILDILRVLTVPDTAEDTTPTTNSKISDLLINNTMSQKVLQNKFLVVLNLESSLNRLNQPTLKSKYLNNKVSDGDSDDDEDDDDDDEGNQSDNDEDNNNKKSLTNTTNNSNNMKKRKQQEEDAALLFSLSNTGVKSQKKLKASNTTIGTSGTTTITGREPLALKLFSLKQHKKLFSKVWLLFLSMNDLTLSQHKLILKHLPLHLMKDFDRPILLSDYLTQCYNYKGIIAVLSLESLFYLIIYHNLDYPRFFESLYCLCTAEVFSAKHRSTFMKLLSDSLKSTNLPG